LRQSNDAAVVRQDPKCHLRQAPFGAVRGDDQIAAIRHDAADADRNAVHRGDDRLGKLSQHLAGGPPAMRQAFDEGGHRALAMGARVLQIGAGRERAACLVAGQHRNPDLAILRHFGAARRDLLVKILAPAIARLGSAEDQPANTVALFVEHRHRGSPCKRAVSPTI
jgi:hypothetical protein